MSTITKRFNKEEEKLFRNLIYSQDLIGFSAKQIAWDMQLSIVWYLENTKQWITKKHKTYEDLFCKLLSMANHSDKDIPYNQEMIDAIDKIKEHTKKHFKKEIKRVGGENEKNRCRKSFRRKGGKRFRVGKSKRIFKTPQ